MKEELKLINNCIGYVAAIINANTNFTAYCRIICVGITPEEDKLLVYLSNGYGMMSISKNTNEYNQYMISLNNCNHIYGSQHFRIPKFDIDTKNHKIFFIN